MRLNIKLGFVCVYASCCLKWTQDLHKVYWSLFIIIRSLLILLASYNTQYEVLIQFKLAVREEREKEQELQKEGNVYIKNEGFYNCLLPRRRVLGSLVSFVAASVCLMIFGCCSCKTCVTHPFHSILQRTEYYAGYINKTLINDILNTKFDVENFIILYFRSRHSLI